VQPANSQSILSLLKKYDLRPRKGLGQNFLVDSFHLEKIIEAADLSPEDTVLEIGPGPGTLTRFLTEAAGQVIAVELDPHMVNLLQNEYGNHSNLSIIEADILKTDVSQLITASLFAPHPSSFKVVANLPYYITSAVMRHLLESTPRPQRIVVTVQKEVAQRIVAQPGKMSILAVSVQFYGQPTLVHRIPAGAFYPPPKVDSAVVCIDTFDQLPVRTDDIDYFFRVVKAGFSQKRKQLKNSLSGGLQQSMPDVVSALQRAEIDPSRRAETLSLAEWGRLAAELADV
jgi:16S rRNA (adenine1518-N6/adenine1519-N6)-dimethyltransferase